MAVLDKEDREHHRWGFYLSVQTLHCVNVGQEIFLKSPSSEESETDDCCLFGIITMISANKCI